MSQNKRQVVTITKQVRPVMGPQGQMMGQQQVEMTKVWPITATLGKVWEYINAKGTNSCVIIVESENPDDDLSSVGQVIQGPTAQ
jgi:hypothetical protein